MHEVVYIAYACDLIRTGAEFRDEILLRGGECKTREKKFKFSEKRVKR